MPSISQLSPTTGTTVSFSPPEIVVVNSYWLSSLFISILCALMALSLQRWAQPRSRAALLHYSLPEQARLHTLFVNRSDIFDFAILVEALHCLVHVAFAIFLAGLLLYFYNVSSTIHFLMTTLIWLTIFVYAALTVIPFFRPGSPHSTPLSSILAVTYAGILHGTSQLFYWAASLICASKATHGVDRHRFVDWYLGLIHFAREKARELAPQLDGDILKRTLDMLRSDDDLEQLFESIPGFCLSDVVEDPRRSLDILGQERLAEALVGFWNRTLSSNRLSESVKGQRLIICTRVIEAADLSIAVPRILHLSGDLSGLSGLVEIGHRLGIMRNGSASLLVRVIISRIISINDEHDKRWITLTTDELGISEDVLRRYLKNGNSLLLANLIHITHQFFLLQRDLDLTQKSLSILQSLSKFDILDSLPELQHEFCALWNKIVQQAQHNWANNKRFVDILVKIQGLYAALHGADATFFASTASHNGQQSSYHLCTVSTHRIQDAGDRSHSSPVALPDVATDIVDTFTSSMAEHLAWSSSGIGEAPRPDGRPSVSFTIFDSVAIGPDYIQQGLGSPPSLSFIALSHSNLQAPATVTDPDITRRPSSVTLGANDNS